MEEEIQTPEELTNELEKMEKELEEDCKESERVIDEPIDNVIVENAPTTENLKKSKKETVKQLLASTNREGVNKLVAALEHNGFFEAPASTRFHSNYEGGLIDHCTNIYNLFKDRVQTFQLEISEESIIICSFLHDVCKVGAYIKKENGGYKWNQNQPAGHSKLSLKRIQKYIILTDMEIELIQFHMGMYGSYEFAGQDRGEYNLKELVGIYGKNKIAKLFYFCDDMSSQFLEK